MATYSANDLIGKKLIATGNITAFWDGYNSKSVFLIYPGSTIGEVYSWVQNPNDGSVWWEFFGTNPITQTERAYFVKQDNTKMKIDTVDAATTVSKEQQAADIKAQQAQDTQGTFVYYAERWGKPLLAVTAITFITIAVIKSNARY